MTSAFEDERMGAASPWMDSWLNLGAAAAHAASERAIRPLIVTPKEGDQKSINLRLQESKTINEKKSRNAAAMSSFDENGNGRTWKSDGGGWRLGSG